MKVFVAGASGAIGLPLVSALLRQGHAVTGMTRSELGAEKLLAVGAKAARVSAFDASGLEEALRNAKAEVVIDELTALPKDPAEYGTAFPGDRQLRLEGGGNLHLAAQTAGRYLQHAIQSGYDNGREMYTMTVDEVLEHAHAVVKEAGRTDNLPSLPVINADIRPEDEMGIHLPGEPA